jgi:hypothetical protein
MGRKLGRKMVKHEMIKRCGKASKEMWKIKM